MQRGIVTLAFDDGYQHILDDILPLLNERKIPAVFAIPLDGNSLASDTGYPVANLQGWREATSRSPIAHELAAHSISHTDLTTLSLEDLESNLSKPAHDLQAATLVYPGGAYNDHVRAASKKYYKAARTVRKGFNTLPPTDPLQLKTYNFTRHNFSPTRANLLALWACLTNSWLIETYHIVSDHDANNVHAVSLQAFKKHLAFLAKSPVQIMTIRTVVNSSSQ